MSILDILDLAVGWVTAIGVLVYIVLCQRVIHRQSRELRELRDTLAAHQEHLAIHDRAFGITGWRLGQD